MIKFMLAETYDDSIDPAGYFLSEKLDGIRCQWFGHRLVSRNGNTFNAPEWFTRGLTKIPLDGELWLSRGQFQKTVPIVKSTRDKGWKDIKFMVFDLPSREAGPFEQRYAMLQSFIKQINNPYILLVPQTKCPDRTFFKKAMSMVLGVSGEGLMLRRAGSFYEPKRSNALLKAKQWHDAEAIVTGYQPGKNSFADKMGALLCLTIGTGEVQSGLQVKVGTGFGIEQRINPPSIGSTITYRYRKLSDSGKPVHPSYVGIRIKE